MFAAWYERPGDAREVLQYGEMEEQNPGNGEVRVRLTRSGINAGDVKKRLAWQGGALEFPRIIPHSDGAGTIDLVGPDVHPARVGTRVWVFGAQSYRAFGTAAQSTVLPSDQAIPLPDSVSDDVGACLGIPGITAHRAVFADGDVNGQTIIVHGVLGTVSSLAAQLARRAGATVIGTVQQGADIAQVPALSADHVIALDDDPIAAIKRLAPGGVDRVVEVAFSANIDLDLQVCRNGATIAAYSSPDGQPTIPFWQLLFHNITIRLLGGDDFSNDAKQLAAADLRGRSRRQDQRSGRKDPSLAGDRACARRHRDWWCTRPRPALDSILSKTTQS